MKFVRLAFLILMAAWAQTVFADSIPTFYITQVSMTMGFNDGSGDNLSFTFTGPGLKIVGYGGMACLDWCSGPVASPDGSPGQIYISNFTSVMINGTTYNPEDLGFQSIFSSNGGLNRTTTGFVGEGDTFLQFNMISPAGGDWNLSFTFFPDGNPPYYLFSSGTFEATAVTPEPGTLTFMLSGLTAITGMATWKHLLRRGNRAPGA
jgi:hypothetical protein